MNRIDIEFAPLSVPRVLRRTRTASWLFLLTTIALWAFIAITALKLNHQRNVNANNLSKVMQDAQRRLDAQNARKQAISKVTIPEAQVNAVNKAIEQLNLPWRDLFNAIKAGDYPSWTLHMQIMPFAEAETYRYNPFDLTKVWPHSDYPLIPVGKLTLNRNLTDYHTEI